MKIGIGFPARSYEQVGEYVRTAAKYPFESLICYGDFGDLPPYLSLGLYGRELVDSPINLVGPLGVPVGRMDTELLGSHARLFEQALGTKALAGLVRGAFLEQIGQRPATLVAMDTAVSEVRKQAPNTNVVIGGFGSKILQLAASKQVEYVKLGGSANTELARQALAIMAKSSSENLPGLILGAVTVIDNDRTAARNKARHEVVKYLNVVGSLDHTLNPDQRDSLNQFQQLYAAGDAGYVETISDSLLDAFSYSGTADEVYERAISLSDFKYIDHIQFGTPHGLKSNVKGVEMLGEIALALKDAS